ncbi:hypothetical protein J5N97_002055 [Dioscorea zingiberensis]|uniref:Late embryogenesis abundant protein LEA-2 subgroup domain-containing protein n=1 Tax=Dioscorea zingiberensis TaxID=325984 RepID=A0A9D5BSV1_9LILI|nr:hypothetical protein J5N97_002055 [Dioscorea zingiberensis]
MAVSRRGRNPTTSPLPSKTNLASCFVAAAFLILLISTVAIVFFILFRPRDPTISVSAVQLPGGFSGGNGTVSFTFSQYAAVRNPNRDAFSHYDSTLQLVYGGSQVGFMFIPAGDRRGQDAVHGGELRRGQTSDGGGRGERGDGVEDEDEGAD